MGEKMKLQRKEVVALVNGLRSASRLSAPPPNDNRKFAYAVARNMVFLTPVLKATAELEAAFRDQCRELSIAHAVKDDKGEPVIKDGHYVIADEPEFEKLLAPLTETHDSDMAEEVEVELHKVAYADIPPSITGDQMFSILPIIKDPPAES